MVEVGLADMAIGRGDQCFDEKISLQSGTAELTNDDYFTTREDDKSDSHC